MCVTNIARRTPNSLVKADPSTMIAKTPSLVSQRLVGNFMPLMMNSTNSTGFPFQLGGNENRQQGMDTVKPEPKKPRRRRKPQKPGKTAKHNERHFVVHNYHDHATEEPENNFQQDIPIPRRRGGVAMSFPMKLHAILDQVEADGLAHVISWQPHGRCFAVHKVKEFTDFVMPKYFRQTKLTSFQRQLNLYGFSRLTTGRDSGGYYHELFLRGKLFLAKRMMRTKVKGTKFKAASSPEQEPNFYTMVSFNFLKLVNARSIDPHLILPFLIVQPPVRVTPSCSSDESSGDEENCYGSIPSMAGAVSQSPRMMNLISPDVSSLLEPTPIFSQAPAPLPVPTFRGTSNDDDDDNDNAFDAAVDEIFYDGNPATVEDDFNNIWDPSMEVKERIDDDEQLGHLLEQLLQGEA
eukprot:scaffold24656_cov181-Cylindrotheca_fusiformis.AAC.5